MWQTVLRIFLVGLLGYGLYRATPVVWPKVTSSFENSELLSGTVAEPVVDWMGSVLGVGTDEDGSDEELDDDLSSESKVIVGEAVEEAKEKVVEKVKDSIFS